MATVREEIKKRRGKKTLEVDPGKLPAFQEQKEDARKYLRIMYVPFLSPASGIPKEYITASNVEYYLRVYLPKAASSSDKPQYLFLMFNGLGEAGPMIYDDVGLELAKMGVASMLIPLPEHYHRQEHFAFLGDDIFAAKDKAESRVSAQLVISEITAFPKKLVYAYKHIMDDIDRLLLSLEVPALSPAFQKFYDRFLSSDTKICLFGYSLGGLIALALFLRSPERFHSCYLLESGANFDQINAGILFRRPSTVVQEIWDRRIVPALESGKKIGDLTHWLVCEYDSKENKDAFEDIARKVGRVKDPAKIQIPPGTFTREQHDGERIWFKFVADMIRDYEDLKQQGIMSPEDLVVFEKVVLGDHSALYKEDLLENCTRILIILGGSDVIYQMDAIASFSPRDTGLAILQIPKLGHWLKFRDRRGWVTWKRFIGKTILEFADVVSQESPSA